MGLLAYRDFFHEGRVVGDAVADRHAFWSHFQLPVGLRPFCREFDLGDIPDDLDPSFFPLRRRRIVPRSSVPAKNSCHVNLQRDSGNRDGRSEQRPYEGKRDGESASAGKGEAERQRASSRRTPYKTDCTG